MPSASKVPVWKMVSSGIAFASSRSRPRWPLSACDNRSSKDGTQLIEESSTKPEVFAKCAAFHQAPATQSAETKAAVRTRGFSSLSRRPVASSIRSSTAVGAFFNFSASASSCSTHGGLLPMDSAAKRTSSREASSKRTTVSCGEILCESCRWSISCSTAVMKPSMSHSDTSAALVKMRRYCAVASRFSIGGTLDSSCCIADPVSSSNRAAVCMKRVRSVAAMERTIGLAPGHKGIR
mmetsp:Transcript_93481/g.129820  ORF Transcript_93481/g.129820 Transcript_93481/m.129820 type:complete len:237 (-) Transcript_93481:26-736(-)